ncbi:unnamed protein product [Ranitomeya imitator]|uniref:MADF domain-containing protein n=1 Tax=Ranitomeya imitator TaxID=111125 RepID=A0ABN9LFS3_9NEOB|nr:unnamed protein product [Ranitomeya imitator]
MSLVGAESSELYFVVRLACIVVFDTKSNDASNDHRGSRSMSANEQDCVRALIEMYRSLPCLWKIKSADYSNRYKKKDAYENLVAIYKEHHPTETVDEHIVRKKIQALRTVYKKELNKVEKSLKSGAGTDDVYVPKLWYYDLLAFTRTRKFLVRARLSQAYVHHRLKRTCPSLRTSMCLFNSGKDQKGTMSSPISPPEARVSRIRHVHSGHLAKESRQRGHLWISWQWLTTSCPSMRQPSSPHSQPWLRNG